MTPSSGLAMGRAAREYIRHAFYTSATIGPSQEDGYRRAITRAQHRIAEWKDEVLI